MSRVVRTDRARYEVIEGSGGARSCDDLLEREPARRAVREVPSWTQRESGLLGASEAIQAIRDDVRQAAASGCESILITGETGTGKEVVARDIQRWSPVPDAPFVAVSCPAIPDTLAESELFGHTKGSFTGATTDHRGFFSMADGGTLFLDEVGDLSPRAQAVLLRVLETRQLRPVGATREQSVRVRVVAATNVELDGASDRFRQDLYYRLSVFRIHIPPLRERVEDVMPLAEHFLSELAKRRRSPARRFGGAARLELESHAYPGNVRELRAVVERAVIRCDEAIIEPRHLCLQQVRRGPAIVRALPAPGIVGSDAPGDVRVLMLGALERSRWNRRQAAAELGVPYSTFRYRLLQLGIK